MEYNNGSAGISNDRASSRFARSGKVMLSSVLVLFAVVAFFLFFHSYVRRAFRRSRSRRQVRRRGRILDSGRITAFPAMEALFDQGLDVSILKSLPTFVYSKDSRGPVQECAVCLSEFEDNEKGRVLSECNHCFHNECIEMWFHSHSNCPLCRAPVHLHAPSPAETAVQILKPAGCAADDDESETLPSSSLAPGTLTLMECPRTPLELVGMTVDTPAIRAGEWRGSAEL